MRLLLFFFFYGLVQITLSQEVMTAQFNDSISLNADVFMGVDDFGDYYYTKRNTLYKKTLRETYSYTNTQLGNITSIDLTNPLKILVFYRDFNTIVILDNRLNELTDRINLNEASYAKNATFATISSNNNLWLYSLDDNILTLWNYETKQTVFDSQPLQFYQDDFETIFQSSSYEDCWLASTNGILQFNEYGSFIKAEKFVDISNVQSYKNGVTFIKGTGIFFHESEKASEIKNIYPKHLSTNYFVNKNKLYFFSSNWLYQYDILKN